MSEYIPKGEGESTEPRSIVNETEYQSELEDRLRRVYQSMEINEYHMANTRWAYHYTEHHRNLRIAKHVIQDLIYYAVTGNEPEQRIPF